MDWVRSCGSTCMGMSEEKSNQLNQILKDKKFHLTGIEDGNYGVCVCASKHTTMFKNMDEARNWIRDKKDCEYYVKGKPLNPCPGK